MVKPQKWAVGWKCLPLKALSSPQILGPKNKLEKRTIIEGTLVMSVGSAIIKYTEKVWFFSNLISGISGFYCPGNSSHSVGL